jgi:hypothetical protein
MGSFACHPEEGALPDEELALSEVEGIWAIRATASRSLRRNNRAFGIASLLAVLTTVAPLPDLSFTTDHNPFPNRNHASRCYH